MRNKFTRLLICDHCLALQVALILLLAAGIGVQRNMLKGLDQKYTKTLKEQALVSTVKNMERSLKSSRDSAAPKVAESGFSFEGYIAEGNDGYAIIDSKVYQVGDRVRDYRVDKIDTGSVVLGNVRTGEQKILKLSTPNS